MRFLEHNYQDPEYRAVACRIIRKERLNAAADGLFHILTLGMLPEFRVRLFSLQEDREIQVDLRSKFRRVDLRQPVQQAAENPAGDPVA